jgi:hypothetical protein
MNTDLPYQMQEVIIISRFKSARGLDSKIPMIFGLCLGRNTATSMAVILKKNNFGDFLWISYWCYPFPELN